MYTHCANTNEVDGLFQTESEKQCDSVVMTWIAVEPSVDRLSCLGDILRRHYAYSSKRSADGNELMRASALYILYLLPGQL